MFLLHRKHSTDLQCNMGRSSVYGFRNPSILLICVSILETKNIMVAVKMSKFVKGGH